MDAYVVIGHPIAHSKSPDLHRHFAQQTGIQITYDHLYAPLDGFLPTITAFIQRGGKGSNVTMPFKLEAYALATRKTERALLAGAVNTLQFLDDGIVGDNTDGVGLVRDIVHNAGVPMAGKRVLVVGAGGAARGVLQPILAEKPAEFVLVNRTASKAKELAEEFRPYGEIKAGGYADATGRFDVIINATAASMSADLPELDESVFGDNTFCYDMVYANKPTLFMEYAARHGAQVRDGLGMLVEQAAESFLLWHGVRPETAEIYEIVRRQGQQAG